MTHEQRNSWRAVSNYRTCAAPNCVGELFVRVTFKIMFAARAVLADVALVFRAHSRDLCRVTPFPSRAPASRRPLHRLKLVMIAFHLATMGAFPAFSLPATRTSRVRTTATSG